MVTTITETTFGPVQGRIKDDVLLFAGIPYAAAPTAELRFKAAQPHAGWSETRQATRFSPAAPQIPTGGMTDNAPVNWNEDCLFLNITTPMIDNNIARSFSGFMAADIEQARVRYHGTTGELRSQW